MGKSSRMEKRKPTYDLESFKSEFCAVDRLRMTGTARATAFALGFTLQDVVEDLAGRLPRAV